MPGRFSKCQGQWYTVSRAQNKTANPFLTRQKPTAAGVLIAVIATPPWSPLATKHYLFVIQKPGCRYSKWNPSPLTTTRVPCSVLAHARIHSPTKGLVTADAMIIMGWAGWLVSTGSIFHTLPSTNQASKRSHGKGKGYILLRIRVCVHFRLVKAFLSHEPNAIMEIKLNINQLLSQSCSRL